MFLTSANLWTFILLFALVGPSFSLTCKYCSDATEKLKSDLELCEQTAAELSDKDKINVLNICEKIKTITEGIPKCSQPEYKDCDEWAREIGGTASHNSFGRTILFGDLARSDTNTDMACGKTTDNGKDTYSCFVRETTDECLTNEKGTICYCETEKCEPKSSGSGKSTGSLTMSSWLFASIGVALSLTQIMSSTASRPWLD